MLSERRFDALIASIYEAAADFRRWPDTLRLMAQAYEATTVVFGRTSEDVADAWILAPDIDQAEHERYASHFHHINPLWRLAMAAPIGTAQTDRMMVPKQELARTEFFNDFLLPQGLGSMLGAAVHAEHGHHFHIVVQKSADFELSDIRLYERLAPHLQRAVQINVKLARLDMQCAASADALDQLAQGAFLVDAAGRVLFANRAAARLTEARGCLRLVAGVLRAKSASDTAKLHAHIASCGERGIAAGGGSLSLTRGAERTPVNLAILPWRPSAPTFSLVWRPVAIIFATDPDVRPSPPTAMMRQRYGLTRAEAAFALEILRGDGIQACADRLGITRATARTHLSHIFRKTSTQRQAELVRLLIGAQCP
jgi:DNA-binding CsgD family transcriptional regulator/PAS domain-containing protein